MRKHQLVVRRREKKPFIDKRPKLFCSKCGKELRPDMIKHRDLGSKEYQCEPCFFSS